MIPIHKTTHVPLNMQDAFDLFIKDIDKWWPKDSHGTLGPDAKIVVEPCKDGQIIEIGKDGTRNIWGRIIGWAPGSYLSFTWHPEGQEDDATVVAVSFQSDADGTRLDLTHGGFEILGETADAVSASYLVGWDLVLGAYCFAASKVQVFA